MGTASNQQESEALSATECAVQILRRGSASHIRRPGRPNSVLAAAICLACRWAKRPSDPKSATNALHARSAFILRSAALFTHRVARTIAGAVTLPAESSVRRTRRLRSEASAAVQCSGLLGGL